jgi:sugar/nucleoside kinase (ribokinase family)
MLEAGVTALIVTLGPRGVVYVSGHSTGPARTALVPPPRTDGTLDPTGCGDVFGAATFARLLAGEQLEAAIAAGAAAGARNAGFRGATGLSSHLRGELVAP